MGNRNLSKIRGRGIGILFEGSMRDGNSRGQSYSLNKIVSWSGLYGKQLNYPDAQTVSSVLSHSLVSLHMDRHFDEMAFTIRQRALKEPP
jgi:hypothetical protein